MIWTWTRFFIVMGIMALMAYGAWVLPYWLYGDHGPFAKPGIAAGEHE